MHSLTVLSADLRGVDIVKGMRKGAPSMYLIRLFFDKTIV